MYPEQNGISIRILLKQAYTVHVTKVKGLENEVEDLKNKLLEAERKLKEFESDCKRCAELEEAFKSCKAALLEQTKWFENIGQKFSAIDSSDAKTLNKNSHDVPNDLSSSQQLSKTSTDKCLSVKQDFLKNLMSFQSDEFLESLDLCTTPFPGNRTSEYSTLNHDSLVLAPDTVDILIEPQIKNQNKVKCQTDDLSKANESEKSVGLHLKETVGGQELQEKSRLSKKRTLTEASVHDGKTKSKKNKASKSESSVSETGNVVKQDRNDLAPTSYTRIPVDSLSMTVKQFKAQSSSNTSVRSKRSENNVIDVSLSGNPKKKNVTALDIQICKDTATPFNPAEIYDAEKSTSFNPIASTSAYQVSPSLLPIGKKTDQPLVLIEDNDFQSPIGNKKHFEDEANKKLKIPKNNVEEDSGAWTVCDKKKLKKSATIKPIKSSSRFKMNLDSLPPNYKKPTYRQTKLSKSIFQPKPSISAKKVLNESNSLTKSPHKKDRTRNSQIKSTNRTGTVDFDATCIPDNYEYEIIPSGNVVSRQEDGDASSDDSILLVDGDVVDEDSENASTTARVSKNEEIDNLNENDNEVSYEFEDFLSNDKANSDEPMNSFDRLPKKEEPNYKYKEETVRKKAERKQLNAFDCKECENYFADLGLSDKEKQERLKKCSRHRSKNAPPPTPEHFWELEFPDTQECRARGYLNTTQKVKLKTHRRRPL